MKNSSEKIGKLSMKKGRMLAGNSNQINDKSLHVSGSIPSILYDIVALFIYFAVTTWHGYFYFP